LASSTAFGMIAVITTTERLCSDEILEADFLGVRCVGKDIGLMGCKELECNIAEHV